MAAKSFLVVVNHPSDNIKHESDSKKKFQELNRLSAIFAQLAGRIKNLTNYSVLRDAVVASGTVTCASVLAADTVTVGGIVFTAVTGAPGANQFDRSGTDTATAASLVSAINSSATAGAANIFNCSSALGVVTVAPLIPGQIGNAITLASSNGGRLAVSGTRLASGAGSGITYTF